jgi:uncharacterized membrane protein YkvA (DUF1232 family)
MAKKKQLTDTAELSNTVSHHGFTEERFWKKITRYASKAGIEVIEKALWLYYAAQKPNTPTWAKNTVYAALLYFISPIDAIIDITPFLGYSDDLGVLALAVSTIALYIDKEVKQQAQLKLQKWFPKS